MAQHREVDVSPYVASAIIEHAKRRCVAAGYLLGVRNVDNIHISDFVPMTNSPPYADVSSKAYINEFDRRVRAKQAFTKTKLIGWYAAGSRPKETTEEQMKLWCEAPATSFAHRIARQALYIHCALPSLFNDDDDPNINNNNNNNNDDNTKKRGEPQLEIRWSAYLTRNQLIADERDKTKMHAVCTKVLTLRVNLTTQDHIASNVVLDHVRSLVFYAGESTQPRRGLLNLDYVSKKAGKEREKAGAAASPVAEALLAVQGKLEAAITAARQAIAAPTTTDQTPAPASTEAAQRLLAQLEAVHAIKEEDSDTQHYASSREDVNTQRFKDALMIKCMVMLLRKEIGQISALAYQYHDGNRQGGGGGGGGYAGARNYL